MLSFFDADIGIGHTGLTDPTIADPVALLAMLDHYGIADALLYDRGAVESGRFDRLDLLLAFCAGSARLHPTISLAPPATGEMPPPDELLDFIRTGGIKAVRVWPTYHAFDFELFSFGALLEKLAAHRIPVIYHSVAVQDHPWEHRVAWRNIREVALAFPALPIVVTWIGMLDNRRTFPVLEQCPNILTDLTCVSFQYIEYVVEHFGSHRLVLASHFPLHDPGLYTTWITYSGLTPAERAAIAGGNLRQLVEGIR